MFGIILSGECRIGQEAYLSGDDIRNGRKMIRIGEGDMFGQQNLSEQNAIFQDDLAKWKFDIVAETNGHVAILLFNDVKMEIRKSPVGVSKLFSDI